MADRNTAQSRREFAQWQGKEPGADWVKEKPYSQLWMFGMLAVAALIVAWLVMSAR